MFFPSQRIKRYLWAKLMERMHLDWTLRSGIRVKIRSYSDWCSYNEIFTNDEYTLPIRETIAAGEHSLQVLDLGANFGYFTLRLADMFTIERHPDELNVWMVEASPSVCAELTERIEKSKAKMTWTVRNGLVGKRTGSATLNYAREDNQNFVNESDHRGSWTQRGGAQELSYLDLAAMLDEIPAIDLIKCDIEGSEFNFLESYSDLLAKTARVVIEFHTAFGDVAAALERLAVLGFNRRIVLREDAVVPVIYLSRV